MKVSTDIRETLIGDKRFSTFAALMESSGSYSLLDNGGEFTVFAPTNEAFERVPKVTMEKWQNEPGQGCLRSLLHYHIVPGRILAGDLSGAAIRRSAQGEEIRFDDRVGLKVNESSVISKNILASNGVIHSLDTVLIRPSEFISLFPLTPIPREIPAATLDLPPSLNPDNRPARPQGNRYRRSTFVL